MLCGQSWAPIGICSREGQGLKVMASAELEPIKVVLGRSPQQNPGAKPLVRVQGQSSLEAEIFEAFVRLKIGPKLCRRADMNPGCLSVF